MEKSISVRVAVHSDLPWIVNELKSFSKFYGTKHNLFPTEELAHAGMLHHIDFHVLLVAESAGELLGFIAGVYNNHVFNPTIRVLNESFWWVSEQHRGTRAGLLLLNAFTDIGKVSADWVIFTLEHKSPVNPRCLLKRGYRPIEQNYIMENIA